MPIESHRNILVLKMATETVHGAGMSAEDAGAPAGVHCLRLWPRCPLPLTCDYRNGPLVSCHRRPVLHVVTLFFPYPSSIIHTIRARLHNKTYVYSRWPGVVNNTQKGLPFADNHYQRRVKFHMAIQPLPLRFFLTSYVAILILFDTFLCTYEFILIKFTNAR